MDPITSGRSTISASHVSVNIPIGQPIMTPYISHLRWGFNQYNLSSITCNWEKNVFHNGHRWMLYLPMVILQHVGSDEHLVLVCAALWRYSRSWGPEVWRADACILFLFEPGCFSLCYILCDGLALIKIGAGNFWEGTNMGDERCPPTFHSSQFIKCQ